MPGTTGKFRCGGLLVELQTAGLVGTLRPTELVTYRQREPDHPFWEDLLRHGHSPTERRAENTFVGRSIQKLTGKTPSYTVVNSVSYGIHVLTILATLYRIWRGA